LEKIFGRPEIVMYPYHVFSVQELVQNVVKPRNIRVVIGVVPMTIVAQLLDTSHAAGFEVWQPKMMHLHNHDTPFCKEFDPDRDVILATRGYDNKVFYRHSRFMFFQRIKAITVDAEPVLPPGEKQGERKEVESRAGVVEK
jgi:hypothetical protein